MTILVVDDEPDVLFLLRVTLEAAGYTVVEAANGEEALATIGSALPTLVITDLMMPVMNGRELIQHMRAHPHAARIPIMVLTANPSADIEADLIIHKPFNPRELTRAIDELVGGAA